MNILQVLHNKEFKQGGLFSFFSFISSGINFILLFIIANFLTTSDYGLINLFTTYTALFAIFSSLGCMGYQDVIFFKSGRTEYKKSIFELIIISTIVLLFSFVFLWSIRKYCLSIFGLNWIILFFACLICYLLVYYNVVLENYRINEKVYKYGLLCILNAVANFLFTIIFVVVLKRGWHGRVYAQICAVIIISFICLVIILKSIKPFSNWPQISHFNYILKFGIPLIPHQASFWIRQSLDRIFLQKFYSFSLVGLFGFAYNFANIIIIIGTAFNAVSSVTLYKYLSKDSKETRFNIISLYFKIILFYVVMALLILILSLILIPYVFPAYNECRRFLFPLSISALFQSVYMLFVNILFYFQRTKLIMSITTSCAFLQAVLLFLFVRFNPISCAYISALISIVITSLIFYYSNKIYKLPWKVYFANMKIFGS